VTKATAWQAALRQCGLHAAVLEKALHDLDAVGLPDDLSVWNDEIRRILDQLAYRYGKLQDSLGEKVLPGILELAEEPLAPRATFAEKLQRLERLGVIASAEQWRLLREMRNAPWRMNIRMIQSCNWP
jgi:hypothetical protein